MRLGTLIDTLEALPRTLGVALDDGTVPTGLTSYRGYYDQLAIDYDDAPGTITVARLLKDCEQAVGKTYEGYKGGQYEMDRNTTVWVSAWGRAESRAIAGITVDAGRVVIATLNVEDYH